MVDILENACLDLSEKLSAKRALIQSYQIVGRSLICVKGHHACKAGLVLFPEIPAIRKKIPLCMSKATAVVPVSLLPDVPTPCLPSKKLHSLHFLGLKCF